MLRKNVFFCVCPQSIWRGILIVALWGALVAEDGRTGNFVIGSDTFPAALLDLPGVVESYKTYDDNVLIKTADVGQVFP